jgi:hypothetical protein
MEKNDAVSAQSPTQQHRDTDHADKTSGTSLFAWPRAFFLFGARGLLFLTKVDNRGVTLL